MERKKFGIWEWLVVIVICVIIAVVGIINHGSEYCFGVAALSEFGCPSHCISIDGQTCYYDFDRLDWVEPHCMGCYYRSQSNKPSSDAVCTDHGWEIP